jgi:D-xylonolactonase
MVEAVCVWDVGCELGEGPVWALADAAVWFVDIKGRRILRHDPATGEGRVWPAPDQPGFLAPLPGGDFLVGLKTGLHRFDPAGGGFTLVSVVEPDVPGNRLNDGGVDPRGRLWFGSMDDGETLTTGRLYRLDASGPVAVDAGIAITNGPCVSPDGRTLYHTDTVRRTIHAFDLAEDGAVSGKRAFVRIEDGAGNPDGSTIDAEGCVWVALWGGWGVRRYSPAGELLTTVRLPCANITKIAFGGADLRTAYATSAWKGLSAAERAAQPQAGGLFAFPVEVPGLPPVELTRGV